MRKCSKMNVKVVKQSEDLIPLLAHLREKILIPVFGAGFTCGSKALEGMVPSGKDLYKYYKECIIKSGKVAKEELEGESFQDIAGLYKDIINDNTGESLAYRRYLRNNFTKVQLAQEKKQILTLPWPYVYTLNIDDAIEENSGYRTVLSANNEIDDHIFEEEKCVIKIHGDIDECLKYQKKNPVFSTEEYINSLHKNKSLLSRLEHDLSNNRIIYVGCSLDQEWDFIMQSLNKTGHNDIYYCGIEDMSYIRESKLKRYYGISYYLKFNNHSDIYRHIFSAAQTVLNTHDDNLWRNATFNGINMLQHDDIRNYKFLFQEEYPIMSGTSYEVPYFFIPRDVTHDLVKSIVDKPLMLIVGGACSGKSYLIADLAQNLLNYVVYIFDSKIGLADESLHKLIYEKERICLFDDDALDIDQIEFILKNKNIIRKNKSHFVFITRKNNREVSALVSLLNKNDVLQKKDFYLVTINNTFSSHELEKINPRLLKARIPVFRENNTILDNIMSVKNDILDLDQYQYTEQKVEIRDEKDMAVAIMLATSHKIYEIQASRIGLQKEFEDFKDKQYPKIDKEVTWPFERSAMVNTAYKYVVNAEHWLYRELNEYTMDQRHYACIVKAYRLIVSGLIDVYGGPKLEGGTLNRQAPYKKYMRVDDMNRIFNNAPMELIREIFEALNPLLSSDPHYLHQRAKCYIRSAKIEKNDCKKKIEYLKIGYNDANLAASVFSKRYEESQNEKLMISLAHVTYTKALATSDLCELTDEKGYMEYICKAIDAIYSILLSRIYLDFGKKEVQLSAFSKTIQRAIQEKDKLPQKTVRKVEELFNYVSNY